MVNKEELNTLAKKEIMLKIKYLYKIIIIITCFQQIIIIITCFLPKVIKLNVKSHLNYRTYIKGYLH